MNSTIPTSPQSGRIASIDIFRAVTMLCMIFVNDLWTLTDVPHWLEHAAVREDFLGFSDIVFPSFLFVLGMSVPFAIENRIKKGESRLTILKHIIIRTIALLVMGVFIVNTEAGISSESPVSLPVFVLFMVAAFFLIWNVYPKANDRKKYLYTGLQVLGVVILLCLAFVFRDADGGTFKPRWWGILGLIGWAYLITALSYYFFRANIRNQAIVLLLLILLCFSGKDALLGIFRNVFGNGALAAFSMSGMLITLLIKKLSLKMSTGKMCGILISISILSLIVSVVIHPYWIISKSLATPTWLFLCTGIALLFYVFIYWLADIEGKGNWFKIIRPAGTATLTCYLIPYILYSLSQLIDFHLPETIAKCPVGLIKSVLFAFLAIAITALLGKVRIKLKI